MNELIKTVVFVAVGALVGVGALTASLVNGPGNIAADTADETGQPLFPDFKDPLAATSLEIIDYDEASGETRQFKVQQQANGLWTIPSKNGYPADAQRQLEEAAASVIDLKKLGFVTDSTADQELFGVVKPDLQKQEGGLVGVGKLVTLEDKSGNRLAQFIVGKADKDKPKLHYLRLPDQDRVYRVEIDTSKLSTKFEDWIEKDLLKINPWDITQVLLHNYSLDEVEGKIVGEDTLDIKYNDKDSKWTLADLQPGEELLNDKLNDMKNALDQLRIVDVNRKPAGLGRDLRRDEGIQLDDEALAALAGRGFYFTRDGRLLSNEGEAIVRCKDGVEYVLRFGEIAAGGEEPKPADDEAEGDKPAAGGGSNRYIFVMAQFNQDLIPKPDLESQPATPAVPAAEGEEPAAGEQPGEGDLPDGEHPPAAETPGEGESEPAEPATSDEPPAEEGATDPGATQSGGSPAEAPAASADGIQLAQAEGEPEQPAPDAEPAEGDQPKPDQPAADEPPAEQPAAGQTDEEKRKADEEKRKADEQRKKAEDERKRKQDEYDQKVAKGEARVKELNDRFADWFYIVSDATYKKIHLTRSDIIKGGQPPAGEGETGILDELDQIKAQGPQPAE